MKELDTNFFGDSNCGHDAKTRKATIDLVGLVVSLLVDWGAYCQP